MLLNILLVAIILVAVAMVFVILLQRSEGGALGMSGGGAGNFMSARGTGDLLSRTTMILAGAFFFMCLLLTLIGGHEHAKNSIVNHLDVGSINPVAPQPQQQQPQQQQQPAAAPAQALPAPTAPAKPAPSNPLDLFGQSPSAPKGQ